MASLRNGVLTWSDGWQFKVANGALLVRLPNQNEHACDRSAFLALKETSEMVVGEAALADLPLYADRVALLELIRREF